MRKFSFTSSQGHGAFTEAFKLYADDSSWQHTAAYLLGTSWHSTLVGEEENTESDDEDEIPSLENEDERIVTETSKFNPPSIRDWLLNELQKSHENNDEDIALYCALMRMMTLVLSDDEHRAHFPRTSSSSESDNDTNSDSPWSDPAAIEGDVATGFYFKSKQAAQLELNSMSPASMKNFFRKLLSDFVHEDHRKSNIANSDILDWLQKPNAVRNYIGYSEKGLKEMLSHKNIVIPGRSNMARKRDVLAGIEVIPATSQQSSASNTAANEVPAMSIADSTIRAILAKSFLSVQKGAPREHCSLGHRLERPILNAWDDVLQDRSKNPDRGLELVSAFSVGLAAKKGHEYAKDSLDFLIIVCDPASRNAETNPSGIKVWGFEAKGRVTANTAAEEDRLVMNLRKPHNRVSSSKAWKYVQKESELFQLLHHAYVYDLDAVVLAVSDRQGQLLTSVIVDFTQEDRDNYGKVLTNLKDLALGWIYNEELDVDEPISIPESVCNIAATIPTLKDRHTLQSQVNVWHQLVSFPKPIPPLKRLIPTIYAYWNSVKGGSDTTTKLMDDCFLRIPRNSINTETTAITRLIMLVHVINHRAMQMFSAKDNLDYPSLSCYRNAASQRQTFHTTMNRTSKILKSFLDLSSTPCLPVPCAAPHTPAPIRRRAPSRKLVNGILPEEITFAGHLPAELKETPRKHGAMIRNGTAKPGVMNLAKTCTGIPMQRHATSDKSGKCDRCQKTTNWYCTGCRRWLCMTRRDIKKGTDVPLCLYKKDVKGKETNFVKTCFHFEHENAWKKNADKE